MVGLMNTIGSRFGSALSSPRAFTSRSAQSTVKMRRGTPT